MTMLLGNIQHDRYYILCILLTAVVLALALIGTSLVHFGQELWRKLVEGFIAAVAVRAAFTKFYGDNVSNAYDNLIATLKPEDD